MNKFLREQASGSSKRYLSLTKVLVDSQKPSDIIGFHTLSYSELSTPPDSKLYKHYPHPLPILLLNRMAVDLRFQGQRIGEQLLLDAINQVARVELERLTPAPVIGLLVEAKPGKESFYQKYGFVCVDLEEPLRLWLPIDTCIEVYTIINS
ncbi:MAG TPA: GNAT family N-acetyltransferase [Cellvibrio sp.]|nr:GNAT family N-acetyltransferase [Cellvibrio sp.]